MTHIQKTTASSEYEAPRIKLQTVKASALLCQSTFIESTDEKPTIIWED